MSDMTLQQALSEIEDAVAGNEMTAAQVFTRMRYMLTALHLPKSKGSLEDLVTVWVVYDTNTDKKYIKKDPTDGALAIFDYEYEAKAVSTEIAGTSYKKVVLIDPHELNRLREGG